MSRQERRIQRTHVRSIAHLHGATTRGRWVTAPTFEQARDLARALNDAGIRADHHHGERISVR